MAMVTIRKRRPVTAAVAAARINRSVRSVYNYMAEERIAYEARAAGRRRTVLALRARGATWAEIAAEIGVTEAAARSLAWRARRVAGASGGAGSEKCCEPRAPRGFHWHATRCAPPPDFATLVYPWVYPPEPPKKKG